MLNQFKRNQPNVIVIIAFIGIMLWLPLFIFQPVQMSIGYKFSGIIHNFYEFLAGKFLLRNLLSFFLVITIAFLLSMLNTRFLFINFRTQMPGYWFILLTVPFVYVFDIFPILLSTICIVFSMYRLFESYGKKRMAYELIDAGFLISLGSFFYPPVLLLHLFLLISLSFLQNYSWKDWLLAIIGGVIPLAVAWSISYFFGTLFQESYRELFTRETDLPKIFLGNKIFLGSILLLILLASIQMIKVFNLKKIDSRRFFSTLLLFFIVSIIASFIILRLNLLIISIVSLSYLFTHYFYLVKRRRVGSIIFYIVFFTVIISIVHTLFPTIINF